MKLMGGMSAAVAALEQATGVVVPVYLAPSSDAALGRALLADTVAGLCRALGRPECVCLSVDGAGAAREAAQGVSAEYGVTVYVAEENRGKLGAVRHGMRALLRDSSLRYFAVVDQDGDHFPNELVNFVRLALHVEDTAATGNVLVLGRRISRHRPMGYLRGEMEELADRMLLDALNYYAAVCGAPLRLEFATTLEEYPDFHSGYKLFTRPVVERMLAGEVWSEGLSDDCTFRHAVESVLTTEAILAGALLAVMNRSTMDEQPLSTFRLFNRQRMTADKIIWPCRRLQVPAAFVGQWLDNHLPRIQLGTLAPAGREELLETRRLVRQAFGLPDDGRAVIMRPLFI